MGVTRGPCSPSDMHLELVAPIFLCLLTIPSLEAAPQFRGLLRSFFNFNGFPVLDPNEAEQNKKFPTIFSNGLNEVSQATQPVRFQNGRAPTTTAPTTQAPTTTTAPTTTSPTTTAPPTTKAPTTTAPTTKASTTEAPKTKAPTTTTKTTEALTTEAPSTEASSSEVPTTKASTSQAPK